MAGAGNEARRSGCKLLYGIEVEINVRGQSLPPGLSAPIKTYSGEGAGASMSEREGDRKLRPALRVATC